MKKIEVFVKYGKIPKAEERDEEQIRIDRLIGKEDVNPSDSLSRMFDTSNMEFYYRPYILSLSDIHDFFEYEGGQVVLVTEYSGSLPIRTKWKDWKKLWVDLTGDEIVTIN